VKSFIEAGPEPSPPRWWGLIDYWAGRSAARSELMAAHFGKSFARLEKAVVHLERFAHFGKSFGRFEGLFAHFGNTAVWFENSIVN